MPFTEAQCRVTTVAALRARVSKSDVATKVNELLQNLGNEESQLNHNRVE